MFSEVPLAEFIFRACLMLFKFSICKLIVYYTCPSSLGIFQFMFASSLLYVTAHGSQEGISFGGLLTICNWNSLEAGVKLTHGFDPSNLPFHSFFLL